MARITRIGRTRIDRRVGHLRIGFGQFQILHAMYELDQPTQEDVARALDIDKGAVARTIVRLVEEGYLRRRQNPDNRRAYVLELTAEGERMEAEVHAVLRDWNGRLTRGFTKEEKGLAYELLARMLDNARGADDEEGNGDAQA